MIPAFRELDGLEKICRLLSSLEFEVREDESRRKVQGFCILFFGTLFLTLVAGETLFATLMFALIQVEILGTVFSGAAFALLVPTVIGAAHVKLHHEADYFTKWWLRRLSSIGILIFALGVSLMVGFSAWQAAEDAVSVISSGPSGTIGRQQVGGGSDQSAIAGWITAIPNTMLFLGLSFGMIITINFASFCLGRALQAFNILTQTPKVSSEARELIDGLKSKIASLRTLLNEESTARRRLPFDPKVKFAREASHACWQVIQGKLAAARRRFDPLRSNDPTVPVFADSDVESIPNHFQSEEEFTRHLADQMDAMRLHNLVRVLTGAPEEEGKKS